MDRKEVNPREQPRLAFGEGRRLSTQPAKAQGAVRRPSGTLKTIRENSCQSPEVYAPPTFPTIPAPGASPRSPTYNTERMSSERHTRRNFFHGAGAARELAGIAARPIETRSPLDDRSSLIVSVCRRAMACEFEVQLAANRNDNSMEHVFEALDLVEALESQMTVYRDDSEVVRVNRLATEGPVAVEPRLFDLFCQARQLHQETDGALDITSGPLSEVWGFSRREGRVPSDDQIAAARGRVGMQHVMLNGEKKTIAFHRPGMSVNLNSLGKGYALDRMAELLARHEVDDYLLHGGKSSVLARGDQPGSGGTGWRVAIRHPLRPAETLAEMVLRNQSLSTSGAGTQFFIRRGRR